MRFKRPHVTSLDQVRITREGDDAVIEYADPKVYVTNFKLGAERLAKMSDQQILDAWNESLEAREQARAEHEHVAVEIPPGKPQIEESPGSTNGWVPRGDVLRCFVDDGGGDDNQAVIHIDDHELSIEAFGHLLTTYAGWGMRIVFVPDDELHEEPSIEVREPEQREGAR